MAALAASTLVLAGSGGDGGDAGAASDSAADSASTIIGTFSVILIVIATYVIGRQVDPYATSGTRRRARGNARNLK